MLDSPVIEELSAVFGKNQILERERVAERSRSFWDSQSMTARAILLPETTEQIAMILSHCHRHRQPIYVHGGRTGCVGGTDTSAGDLVLSLEKMNAVEEIDEAAMTMTVQAGCILEVAQSAAAEKGLQLPLDLGARGSCMVGGNLATNAGGMNVIRHGMARALTLGLETVLPDGTVLSSMNKMLKNNAGYDLKQLFIGSEGTLGVITRAVLKLEPMPRSRETALVAFDSFDAVSRFLSHMKAGLGADLCGFEIMWGDYFFAVTEPGHHRAPLGRGHAYYVVCEARGQDPQRDHQRFMDVIEKAFEAHLIVDAVLPKSEQERAAIWRIRDDFDAILKPGPVYLYDVSLPIGDMPNYVDDVESQLQTDLPGAVLHIIGHVGDGNLHLFVTPGTCNDLIRELADACVYRPLEPFSGSVSAEHGIGIEKKKWLSQSRSKAEIKLMRRLKQMMDPHGILNPGVIIDC